MKSENLKAIGKLYDMCKCNATSFLINYWEPDDCFEIEVHSSAKTECFYQKRVYDIELFCDDLAKHWSKR